MVYLHNGMLFRNQKRQTHVILATWMKLEEIMLVKISQKEKGKN